MKIHPMLAGLCLLLPLLASAAPFELRDREGRLTTLRFDAAEAALRTAGSPEETGRLFLAEYAPALGLQDPASQLRALPTEVDELGQTHLRWQQVWQGVPVRTGEVALHLDRQGRPQLASAKVVPGVTCAIVPAIDSATARALALQAWLEQYGPVTEPESRDPELVIVDSHALGDAVAAPTLVWQVVTATTCTHHSDDLWVLDAQSGALLARLDQVRYLDRRVYNCSNSPGLTCPSEQFDQQYNYWFGRREGAPARGPNPNTAYGYGGRTDTDDMYDNLGHTMDYWTQVFARNGANNLGGVGDGYYNLATRTPSMILLDHVWDSCPDNAGYFGSIGRFQFCESTASELDIVGHEYFHAVVWFEFSPHGTEYTGEVGALEEGSC
ncbi:MAG: hypothetical protein KDC10_15260, partial [Calditrichaeota bacterium]|nr:hypothetical protein [Calditrichota bacterium]